MRGKKFLLIILTSFIFVSLAQPAIVKAAEPEKPKATIVLVDPGHGPGCVNGGSTGYFEHEGMWKLANYLQKDLERCGIKVELTRTEEEDPSLDERGAKAEGKDLFISLHSNAFSSDDVNGCEVYYSVQQEKNKKHAEQLARVGSEVMENNNRGAHTKESNDHPGEDYYGVMRAAVGAGCPNVFLVESGFHSNTKDEEFLKNDGNLKSLAESYAKVICDILDVEFKNKEAVEEKAGWVLDNGSWYYYDEHGVMQTGWLKVGGKWYYLRDSGSMATGWLKLGDTWYYLRDSGSMATGWVKVGGKWYYLRGSGSMATGWLKLEDTWYYLRDSGSMATGWVKIGGKWYYLRDSGSMATGWLKLGDTWYYLRGSGSMATGWVKIGGKWYYLRNSGSMATGWVKVGGKWYYLYSNGVMAANTTVGGYRLAKDGAWIQ